MKKYETLHLVKMEDLNHHGTLFAAKATAWMVEAGFTAAACEHGNPNEIVLRGMQDVSYTKPVAKGTVVRYESRVVKAGITSLTVCIQAKNAITEEMFLEGYITFVTVDEHTAIKKAHGITLDVINDSKE